MQDVRLIAGGALGILIVIAAGPLVVQAFAEIVRAIWSVTFGPLL